MVSGEVESAPAILRRTEFYVHRWTVVDIHIKYSGREALCSCAKVAGDGKRFQEHLWHNHSGANVKHNATANQTFADLSKRLEVPECQFTSCRTVHRRLLVDNVSPDGRVHRRGHIERITGGQQAHVGIRRIELEQLA